MISVEPVTRRGLLIEYLDSVVNSADQLQRFLGDPDGTVRTANAQLAELRRVIKAAKVRTGRSQPCPFAVERRQRRGPQHERFEVVQGGAR